MQHRPHHRGPHPDDARLFGAAGAAALRAALEDAAYLLERGYAETSVIDVVGRRYRLESRQSLALKRSMCSPSLRQRRMQRRLPLAAVRNKPLSIDGLNVIIGLEVALSGGVLLRGAEGALRDLAGLRGSYRPVDETPIALRLLGDVFSDAAPSAVHFLLDAPVSNSGRLRASILEHAAGWPAPTTATLVANPDRELEGCGYVVSADALVIDRSESWVNLLGEVVRERVPRAWIVDLGPDAN
jgi:hypothetical protein